MTPVLTDEMRQHVLECFPHECCGVMTNNGYFALDNVAKDTRSSFKIRYEDYNLVAKENDIIAVFHSHCRDPDVDYGMLTKFDPRTPSPKDVATQRALGVPFWISATDGTTVEEPLLFPESYDRQLLGRKFIWYVNDCWTLVRDYYWQEFKVDLGWHANDFDWFNEGRGVERPFYKEHFASRGFKQIDEVQLRDGDLIVMGMRGDYNHIGVFKKDFKILQQLAERPSGSYPFSAMKSFIQMYLRYEG